MTGNAAGVALLGLPFDETSSERRGAAAAPAAIRARFASPAGNAWTEAGVDLARPGALLDLGDVASGPEGRPRDTAIRESVAGALDSGRRPLLLGGDHWVSSPVLEAFESRYDGLTVVQVDAHPDLYDRFDGKTASHACTFARVMERGGVRRLVQIGVRASNGHQRQQAERFGVETVSSSRWEAGERPAIEGPFYLSLDLDGFDPAFAPAVAHPEAAGIGPRPFLDWLAGQRGCVGADIVELQPDLDAAGVTVALAAKLLKEVAGVLLRS